MIVTTSDQQSIILLSAGGRAVGVFLGGYVMMLLLFVLFGGLMGNMMGGDMQALLLSTHGVVLLFMLQQVITLVVLGRSLYEGGLVSVRSWIAYMSERRKWKGRIPLVVWVLGGVLTYMLINSMLYMVLVQQGVEIPGLYGEQGVITMIANMQMGSLREWITMGSMVVIIGPLVEELVYRGLITDVLMRRRERRGVMLGAGIFALIHFEFAVIGNLFILAMILGVIYKKTGSMVYSFAFHMLINGMGLLAIRGSQAYDFDMMGVLFWDFFCKFC